MSKYLTGSERGDLISSLNNAACTLRVLQEVCDGDSQLIEDLEASVQSLVCMANGLKETKTMTCPTCGDAAINSVNYRCQTCGQGAPKAEPKAFETLLAEVIAEPEPMAALDDLARVLANEPDWKLKVRFVGALGQYEARVTCRGRLLAEQYSQLMTEAASHALEVAQAGL